MKEIIRFTQCEKIVWKGSGAYYRKPVKKYGDKVVYRKANSRMPPDSIIREFTEKPEQYVYLESGYSSITAGTI